MNKSELTKYCILVIDSIILAKMDTPTTTTGLHHSQHQIAFTQEERKSLLSCWCFLYSV